MWSPQPCTPLVLLSFRRRLFALIICMLYIRRWCHILWNRHWKSKARSAKFEKITNAHFILFFRFFFQDLNIHEWLQLKYFMMYLFSLNLSLDHLLPGNPTYNVTYFSASEVLDNHKSVLTTFGIQTADEELDLPYIYWIPKMHKNPYKHRFIAGSSKCSTKPLSILLTKLQIAYTY